MTTTNKSIMTGKQTVVLGKAGSGRTQYLAKEAAKALEDGKKAFFLTDEHKASHIVKLISENLGTSDPYGKLMVHEVQTVPQLSFDLGNITGELSSVDNSSSYEGSIVFIDLHEPSLLQVAFDILTEVLPVYPNATAMYSGLLDDKGLLPKGSLFNTNIDKVVLRGNPQVAEEFFGTQHVVVGRTGVGRTRYLVKKAIDAPKAEKTAIFITDEHSPETLKDYIRNQSDVLNVEKQEGSFQCISVNTAEGVITALHDVVITELEKGKNIELLIDLHKKGLIKQALNTINTYLNTYKNLDITFSVQVNHDIDPQHSAGIIESESLPFIVAPENITVLGVSAQ